MIREAVTREREGERQVRARGRVASMRESATGGYDRKRGREASTRKREKNGKRAPASLENRGVFCKQDRCVAHALTLID